MQEGRGSGALAIALAVTVATALVAVASVYAVRQILRRDLVDAAEAQRVIRLGRLRGAAESVGEHARGFLLTASARTFEELGRDRAAFFDMLDRVSRSATDEGLEHLDEVRRAARLYDQALESVIALRRREEPDDVVARAFEDTVKPRRDELDRSLAGLIDSEEARLQSMDRSTERAGSRFAATAAAVAMAALLVAVVLALLLGRAFRSLSGKQRELEAALGKLEKANADLDAFASRIAHDLRTPLSPVLLMAGALRRHPDEKVVQAAERIDRATSAASRMLDDLLAFSRIGRHEAASAAAARVIRDTLEDFAEKITSHLIAVETDLDDRVVVACSEALFRQVVGNLVGNALKFLEGCPVRRLRVELSLREDRCHLLVHDTGPGITPEALVHVFDRFYRAPGTRAPGTGLGLAIVRRIVEAHDGSVTAESSPAGGTTFRVVLPSGDQGRQVETPPRAGMESNAAPADVKQSNTRDPKAATADQGVKSSEPTSANGLSAVQRPQA